MQKINLLTTKELWAKVKRIPSCARLIWIYFPQAQSFTWSPVYIYQTHQSLQLYILCTTHVKCMLWSPQSQHNIIEKIYAIYVDRRRVHVELLTPQVSHTAKPSTQQCKHIKTQLILRTEIVSPWLKSVNSSAIRTLEQCCQFYWKHLLKSWISTFLA